MLYVWTAPSHNSFNPSRTVFPSNTAVLKSLRTIKAIQKQHHFYIFGGPFSEMCKFHRHIVAVDFTLWVFFFFFFLVYVWKAIVAAIELDFIFQRQPLPSYRSFHFDAYYNSFTQTREESQQPITPTCIQFTSALAEMLTPPCPTLHCTASAAAFFFFFFFLVNLFDEMKGRRGENSLRSSRVNMHACKIYTWSIRWQLRSGRRKSAESISIQCSSLKEITARQTELLGSNKWKHSTGKELHRSRYFSHLSSAVICREPLLDFAAVFRLEMERGRPPCQKHPLHRRCRMLKGGYTFRRPAMKDVFFSKQSVLTFSAVHCTHEWRLQVNGKQSHKQREVMKSANSLRQQ